jgi:broad specificity phosphatase PhoE
MTTTFVFVRHAQGYHNLDGESRGEKAYYDPIHIDAELTSLGILQAQNNNLGNETFDAVYSSPMKRCRQTLLNIYPISNQLPVILDDRLIEQPQGTYLCNKRIEKYNIVQTIPSIWNADKVFSRNPYILNSALDDNKLISFTNDIKERFPHGKVLIVTHGKWIHNWLLRYTYTSKYINNCEIIRVTM